jgi:hypothetical protein
MSETSALNREAEAAQSLLANLRDIIGDDEQATVDAIEGETNLLETITAVVHRINEIAAHKDGIKDYVGRVKSRLERLERQEELMRTALLSAMATAGLKKLELPTATITMKATAPSAVITDEANIPASFWKPQDPKLDKKAILDSLKSKQDVPGAVLSNGPPTLQIRNS